MRGLPVVLVAIFCLMCSDVALAITSNCPALAKQRNTQAPVVKPMNQPTYLCNNAAYATDPPKLGDLSAQGQAMNMQVCDSNCSYRPLFPEDAESPMIPIKCYSERQMRQPGVAPSQQYAVNGSAATMAANQGPPPPYVGTGGNCQAFMIPQAPINIDQSKPPTVQEVKPKASGSPVPSPSPSPH